MEPQEARRYRSIAARLNFLAADRADLAFAVKEAAREMSKPTRGSWDRLKRVGRYLISHPRAVLRYTWQTAPTEARVFTDSDSVACKTIRKSTSGGCVMLGGHLIKSWSKTQRFIALSSGESEFYAALKASAEALGLLSMLTDF